MKNVYSLTWAAVVVLAMASISCGGGSHLVSVAVSPSPINMNAPQVLQLQAIGTYSDGTMKPLPSASWTLQSPSPAITVGGSGIANCQTSGGSAATVGTVSASYAGVSGSAAISCSGPGV